MKNNSYEKTLEIIKSTSDMPIENALETLIACAKKGNALASVRAIKTIAKLNHPSVAPSLCDIYNWIAEDPRKRDRACDMRIAITEALGNTGAIVGIDILQKAIRTVEIAKLGPAPEDIAIGLRAAAAIALAKVDSDAIYELAILFYDEEPTIPTSPVNRPYVKAPTRKAAAQAMGILRDAGGLAILAARLKFPRGEVPEVLAECLESLICARPSYMLEAIKPYLLGRDEYLSATAALSLAENLGTAALDLLCEAVSDVLGEAKEAIVIAISTIRDSSVRKILLDFLDNPNPFVRRGAVKGIKAYMDDEVKEKLQAMRNNDPDKFVRQAAE